MIVAREPNGRGSDPGIKLVLEEIRDLRVEMREDRRLAEADRQRSDERFDRMMREYHEMTQTMFRQIRDIGFAIVKTLNRHSRLLESIDRKLGARRNGGPGNGRRS